MTNQFFGRARRRAAAASVAVAVAALVAACGSSGAQTGASGAGGSGDKSTISVGFIAPLSGSTAFIGDGYLPVFQAGINAINAQGGVDGHHLQVISEDDTATPTGAITALRTLSSDNVQLIWGSPVSADLQAEIPLAKQLGMVLIGPGITTSMVEPADPNVYGGEILGKDEANTQLAFAQYLDGGHGPVGKVSLIVNNTPASVEWANAVKNVAAQYGAQIVNSELLTTAAESTDLQIRQALAAKPAVVLLQLPDGNMPNVVKELRQDKYSGNIINYHGGGGVQVVQSLNDPKLYVARTIAATTDPAEPGTGLATFEKYISASKAAVNGIGSFGAAPEAYVGTQIIAAGLKACGIPCNSQTLTQKMNTMTVDTGGVNFGPIKYTAANHQGVYDERFYHLVGSKLVVKGGTYTGSGS